MYDENWESHLQFLHCPDYALLTYNGTYLLLGLFFCLHAVLKCKSKFVKIMFIICCLSRNTMLGFISFDRRPILYSWASLATLFWPALEMKWPGSKSWCMFGYSAWCWTKYERYVSTYLTTSIQSTTSVIVIILYHSVAAYICNGRLKETARSKFLFGATLCGASVFLRQVELFWHHHPLLLYNRCDIRLTWVLWNRGSRPGLPSYKFNSLLYAYPESFLSSWRVRTQSLDDCFYGKYKTILFSKLMFFYGLQRW